MGTVAGVTPSNQAPLSIYIYRASQLARGPKSLAYPGPGIRSPVVLA